MSSCLNGPVTKLYNCFLLRNHSIIEEDIWVRDGLIIDPEPLFYGHEKKAPDIYINCHGGLIAPGLIDVQINGAFGVDFTTDIFDERSASECIHKVALGLLSYGVTSFCPTIVSTTPDIYKKIIPNIKRTVGTAEPVARVLGLHLEGPFISRDKRGAHSEEYLRLFGPYQNPISELESVYSSLNNVSIITLAPELDPEGKIIRHLSARGIRVSIGHTNASLTQAESAVRAGASFVTHLFNAMTNFHHRDPGPVGVLASQCLGSTSRVYFGIIADGIHTHPTALRIANRADPRAICLISDGVSAMGLADGEYCLGQTKIRVGNNRAIHADRPDVLAGAILPLIDCVKKLRKAAACGRVEALEAASLHPAEMLGIVGTKGTLDFGSDADFIILSMDSLDLRSTWLAGKKVYSVDE